MSRTRQQHRIMQSVLGESYFGTAADLAFNRMHIDLIERHQASMNEGIARAEALLASMRKEKRL